MLPPHLVAVRDDVEAVDRRLALGGREQAAEDPDERGLARAVGPEQAVDLAARDREGHAVERADLPKSRETPSTLMPGPFGRAKRGSARSRRFPRPRRGVKRHGGVERHERRHPRLEVGRGIDRDLDAEDLVPALVEGSGRCAACTRRGR